MRRSTGAALLRELISIHTDYRRAAAGRKLELLVALDQARLPAARAVARLHDCLCFLRAYPDGPQLLAQVERMLGAFERRRDLRRRARELADSGIAGTPIFYAFYWVTARWLVRQWPERLSIDWSAFSRASRARLEGVLYLLVPWAESLAVEEGNWGVRDRIARLKAREETDAAFVVRRFERMKGGEAGRETVFEDLEIPFELKAGADTPSRTRARHGSGPVIFQKGPLDRSRPSLRAALSRPPRSIRSVSGSEGQDLIDLALAAMVTRGRDLFVFRYGDPQDVRMIDCGDGLKFAAIGAASEGRLLLDAVYGFLILKNAVPIGYLLTAAHFNSAEVAYNVFETYRGGESAQIYGRALALIHRLFRVDAFTIDPYQLGHANSEALQSGAWWFYYKLGFRPLDAAVRRVLKNELQAMKTNPRHRSSIATLKKLAKKNLFWFAGRPRRDVRGRIPLENVGMRVSRYVAERFGSDRERAVGTCADDAARLLGVRSRRGFSAAEQRAWNGWSPLVLSLPGVDRWPEADRRALARVVRAKGGRRESDYVLAFDRHRRLRSALLRMAEP